VTNRTIDAFAPHVAARTRWNSVDFPPTRFRLWIVRTGQTILRVLAVISAVVLIAWYVMHESGPRIMSSSKSGRIAPGSLEKHPSASADTSVTTDAPADPPPRTMMSGSKSKNHVLDEEDARQLQQRLMSGSKSAAVFDPADVLPTEGPATQPATAPATQAAPATRPAAAADMPNPQASRIVSPPNEAAAAPPRQKMIMSSSKSGQIFHPPPVAVSPNRAADKPPDLNFGEEMFTLHPPTTQPATRAANQP